MMKFEYNIFDVEMPCYKEPKAIVSDAGSKDLVSRYELQWNLGIRATQGTVKNCPEFWGGLISQVNFYILNRPGN